MLKNKKIAILYPNGGFIQDFIKKLQTNNKIRILDTKDDQNAFMQEAIRNKIYELMQWADIAFFEWCSELLSQATRYPKMCKIICRLHSNEVFVGKTLKVQWSKVDHLIFVNANVRSLASQQIQLPTNSIINVGTDTAQFQIPANKTVTKKIGFSGDPDYKKNGPLMLYCFEKIYRHDPEYTFHVLGSCSDFRMHVYYTNFCRETGLSIVLDERIPKNEMANWYSDKDFILNTSLFEGCFCSGTEAMATGVTPLIHNWFGANMYPENSIFNTPDDCLEIVKRTTQSKQLYQQNRKFVVDNYKLNSKTNELQQVVQRVLA